VVLAYRVQSAWLGGFGESLESTFGTVGPLKDLGLHHLCPL